MSYYKIISNNTVIDANDRYLRWQKRHGILIICEPHEAEFISPRDESAVWHPDWLNTPPEEAVYDGDIEAVEISKDEYAALIEQLDAGKTIENQDTEDGAGEDAVGEPTASEPALSIAETSSILKRINVLEANNQMLTECILEMSELLYV